MVALSIKFLDKKKPAAKQCLTGGLFGLSPYMTPLSDAAEFTMIVVQDWRTAADHERESARSMPYSAAVVSDTCGIVFYIDSTSMPAFFERAPASVVRTALTRQLAADMHGGCAT
ncbi:hypothetical protein H3V53_34495 [Paraburkholderia bengalensis]|uniref:Uncharacterized protein n=1 Tax=Paraburkholderia bengalensis TaxID=2747562 RepID=A0ABU8J316_9BURK